MKRGEETLMPNWVFDALESLTLASDMKLLSYLGRHGGYRESAFSTKKLAIALELDIRTAQAGLARLAAAGHIVSADGMHCIRNAAARLPQAACKSTRTKTQVEPRQEQKNDSLNYKNLRTDELQNNNNTPKSPQQSPARRDRTGVEQRSEIKPTPDGTTPFQAIYEAITVACYATSDGLTTTCVSRIGRAANDLNDAGYAAADVPLIVAWIRKNETWRTSGLTPQVIAEKAPAWKQGKSGNLTLPGTYVRGQEECIPGWKLQQMAGGADELERLLAEVAL